MRANTAGGPPGPPLALKPLFLLWGASAPSRRPAKSNQFGDFRCLGTINFRTFQAASAVSRRSLEEFGGNPAEKAENAGSAGRTYKLIRKKMVPDWLFGANWLLFWLPDSVQFRNAYKTHRKGTNLGHA